MAVTNLKLFAEYVEEKKLDETKLSESEMKYIKKICEIVTQRVENLNNARNLIKENVITIKALANDGVASYPTLSTRNQILADFIKFLGTKYNIKPYEVNYSNEALDSKKDLLEDTQRRLKALVQVDEEKLDLQVKIDSLETSIKRVMEENKILKSRIRVLEKKKSNGNTEEKNNNIYDINDYNDG